MPARCVVISLKHRAFPLIRHQDSHIFMITQCVKIQNNSPPKGRQAEKTPISLILKKVRTMLNLNSLGFCLLLQENIH